VIGPEVLERAGHRLRHLRGQARRGIVRQPVILPGQIRELRLQEEIVTRDHARAIRRGQALPHAGLDVMAPLVGRVDTAKARAHGQLGEGGRAVLLPRGAVEQARRRH